jgi:stress response protein YsnF
MNSVPPSAHSSSQQQSPSQASSTNPAGDWIDEQLTEGEVIRVELYEEVPTWNRETVVREKVQIKKILVQESPDLQP